MSGQRLIKSLPLLQRISRRSKIPGLEGNGVIAKATMKLEQIRDLGDSWKWLLDSFQKGCVMLGYPLLKSLTLTTMTWPQGHLKHH
jgi:hypothetical protein